MTFISKPSSVQYDINELHKGTFTPEEGSESVDAIYSLLEGDLADGLFPQENPDGTFMTQEERLFISGRVSCL